MAPLSYYTRYIVGVAGIVFSHPICGYVSRNTRSSSCSLRGRSLCKRSQGVKFITHWFWKGRNLSHFYSINQKSWKIKHLTQSMGKTQEINSLILNEFTPWSLTLKACQETNCPISPFLALPYIWRNLFSYKGFVSRQPLSKSQTFM